MEGSGAESTYGPPSTGPGKSRRLDRLFKDGRTVIIPMDHGATVGPIRGIEDIVATIREVSEGGATAYVCHKGIAAASAYSGGISAGLIVHLSASTMASPEPNRKVLVGTVADCVRLGADGVSVHVNVGAQTEPEMLKDLGAVSSACHEWGMPLLAMMYPRGPKVDNPYDAELVKHAARLGAELGADVVKTVYTGSVESFEEVVAGCGVPVVIAGGEKMDTPLDLLRMVHDSLEAGGRGISIGRNVFQAQSPRSMTEALAHLILGGGTPEEAEAILHGEG